MSSELESPRIPSETPPISSAAPAIPPETLTNPPAIPSTAPAWLRLARWYLHRNPTYLLSAAAMAVGAKLYLFAPEAPAGQLGLVLLTLGLLQLYEATVAGLFIMLCRSRRSPEDLPSLMLVAALFWTGPLAATLELTELDGRLGLGFAAAACVVALSELAVVRRATGLRLSPAGQLIAVLCLLLIGGAPAVLRVPYGTAGTSEGALYAAWWLLALFALFAIPALRWQAYQRCGSAREGSLSAPACRHAAALRQASTSAGRDAACLGGLTTEALFVGTVLVAAGAHLYAMNYVFYGHAQAFYAAPLLIVAGAAGFELLALRRAPAGAVHLTALLPALAVALTLGDFDPAVRAVEFPPVLRDPLLAALLLAAAAWWYGAARHRSAALLHAGSIALGLAVLHVLPGAAGTGRPPAAVPPVPLAAAWAGYALALYLLVIGAWRRSRVELFAALAVQLAAGAALVWQRWPADEFILLLLAGWSWLAATHFAERPSLRGRVWPVALLVVVACAYDHDAGLCWFARGHALAMTAVLVTAGTLWPATRYRIMGLVAGGAWLAFVGSREVYTGPHAAAAGTVTAAFALLGAAAAISWHKRRLVALAFAARERDAAGGARPVS